MMASLVFELNLIYHKYFLFLTVMSTDKENIFGALKIIFRKALSFMKFKVEKLKIITFHISYRRSLSEDFHLFSQFYTLKKIGFCNSFQHIV